MGWKIAVDKFAKDEINEAIAWNGEKNAKTGLKLMPDLANTLTALEINPYFTHGIMTFIAFHSKNSLICFIFKFI